VYQKEKKKVAVDARPYNNTAVTECLTTSSCNAAIAAKGFGLVTLYYDLADSISTSIMYPPADNIFLRVSQRMPRVLFSQQDWIAYPAVGISITPTFKFTSQDTLTTELWASLDSEDEIFTAAMNFFTKHDTV
jgi:hypothetical protein